MNESTKKFVSPLGVDNLIELSKYRQKIKFSSFNSQNKNSGFNIG